MIIIVKFIKYKRGNIIINFMLVGIISALTIFMCFVKEDSTIAAASSQVAPITNLKTFSSLTKSEINISSEDNSYKSMNESISKDDIITLNIKVLVDNKELNIKSTQKNIELMLKDQKIYLSSADKISPSIQTDLSDNMKVIIIRVKTSTLNQIQPILYKTIIKKDTNLLTSKSRISQAGIQGKKSVTSSVTYENSKEVKRKVIKETIIKAPRNQIIVNGTLKPITFSRGGSSSSLGRIITVKATAYCPVNGAANTYTASGQRAVRNANGFSTIAVDPRIIPIGTKLYVEGYGYAIAADKGSAIKGKFIDLYFNTYLEALNFGVKYLKVQILN